MRWDLPRCVMIAAADDLRSDAYGRVDNF